MGRKLTAMLERNPGFPFASLPQTVQVPKYHGLRSHIQYQQWLVGPYTMLFGHLDPLGSSSFAFRSMLFIGFVHLSSTQSLSLIGPVPSRSWCLAPSTLRQCQGGCEEQESGTKKSERNKRNQLHRSEGKNSILRSVMSRLLRCSTGQHPPDVPRMWA